ncbi:MAG: YbaK/EbsC family protein [Desulfovibrionaceae bacterium]|nr:YbaK/EbsC family protein [Desulfovibrionaceae bacterium]
MRVAQVRKVLEVHGLGDRYIECAASSATVALAAQALGCEEGRIAKSLSCITTSGPIVIVAMGTARLNNAKFKAVFGEKPRFPAVDVLPELIGHPAGGVCPFAVNKGVKIFLDESLKAFDPVYPAAGASNNAVRLSLEELERVTGGTWIDVCVRPEQGPRT